MDRFTRSDLQELVKEKKPPCISIFMTTHADVAQVKEDPLKFKNLLKDARRRLESTGYNHKAIERVLGEYGETILEDTLFWKYQGKGLAVFISPDYSNNFRLPQQFGEKVVVMERFYLKPLLPLLGEGERYYVLALSLSNTRLISATHYHATQVSIVGAPISLKEALKYDDPEKQLQFHSGAPEKVAGVMERSAVFHGHGIEKDAKNKEIVEFFHQLDSGVNAVLKEQRAPLVTAGVENLFGLYKKVNSYPRLVTDNYVRGSPDSLSADELREKAWGIVQPIFGEEKKSASERFMDSLGTGLASGNLEEIVPAAFQGRIDTLFVASDAEQWGTADDYGTSVTLLEEKKPGRIDLLDYAAIQTMINDGRVYVVPMSEVPQGREAAAVFRY